MPFERAAAELSCAGSGGGEEGGRHMVMLVTGAAGFIGAAAAMQLRSLGHGACCPKPLCYGWALEDSSTIKRADIYGLGRFLLIPRLTSTC